MAKKKDTRRTFDRTADKNSVSLLHTCACDRNCVTDRQECCMSDAVGQPFFVFKIWLEINESLQGF